MSGYVSLWVPVVVALLAVAAAGHDVIARTIPNSWCAAITVLGILLRLADHSLPAGAAIAACVFVAATLCWRMGWLGGGDVKLLAALSLAVPPHAALDFITDTSLAGALLALPYWLARGRLRSASQSGTAPGHTRHARESGHPGTRQGAGTLDSRFRGNDDGSRTTLDGPPQPALVGAARRRATPPRLLTRALRVERWRLHRGGPLPYGVAIAAGALIVLSHGALP